MGEVLKRPPRGDVADHEHTRAVVARRDVVERTTHPRHGARPRLAVREGLVDVGPYTEDGEGLVEITTGVERTPIIGDPFLVEGGTFRRRIVGMSGDERGDWVKIITAPERVA